MTSSTVNRHLGAAIRHLDCAMASIEDAVRDADSEGADYIGDSLESVRLIRGQIDRLMKEDWDDLCSYERFYRRDLEDMPKASAYAICILDYPMSRVQMSSRMLEKYDWDDSEEAMQHLIGHGIVRLGTRFELTKYGQMLRRFMFSENGGAPDTGRCGDE